MTLTMFPPVCRAIYICKISHPIYVMPRMVSAEKSGLATERVCHASWYTVLAIYIGSTVVQLIDFVRLRAVSRPVQYSLVVVKVIETVAIVASIVFDSSSP